MRIISKLLQTTITTAITNESCVTVCVYVCALVNWAWPSLHLPYVKRSHDMDHVTMSNTHDIVGVPGAGLLVALLLPAAAVAVLVAIVGVDVAPPVVAGLGSCNHLTCVAGPYLCVVL